MSFLPPRPFCLLGRGSRDALTRHTAVTTRHIMVRKSWTKARVAWRYQPTWSRGLTVKCQYGSLGVKPPAQAPQMTGAAARVVAAMRIDRPHGQAAAIRLVPHQATFARLTIRRRRGSLVWRFRQAM
jgi:hypothetical protein